MKSQQAHVLFSTSLLLQRFCQIQCRQDQNCSIQNIKKRRQESNDKVYSLIVFVDKIIEAPDKSEKAKKNCCDHDVQDCKISGNSVAPGFLCFDVMINLLVFIDKHYCFCSLIVVIIDGSVVAFQKKSGLINKARY